VENAHILNCRLVCDLARQDREIKVLDVLPVGTDIDGSLALVLEALVAVEHSPAGGLSTPTARGEAALIATALLTLTALALVLTIILLSPLLPAKAATALSKATARVEVLGLRRWPIVDHGERSIVLHMEVVEDSVHLLLLRVTLWRVSEHPIGGYGY
jgi:hypothetical protein